MYRIIEQLKLQGTHMDHLAQSLLLTRLTKTKSVIQMSLVLLQWNVAGISCQRCFFYTFSLQAGLRSSRLQLFSAMHLLFHCNDSSYSSWFFQNPSKYQPENSSCLPVCSGQENNFQFSLINCKFYYNVSRSYINVPMSEKTHA